MAKRKKESTTQEQRSKKPRATVQARKRADTYWDYSSMQNASYFASIFNAVSPDYRMEMEEVNLDYDKKQRGCWRVYSEKTEKPVSSLRSTQPYRLAIDWAVHISTSWTKKEKAQLLTDYGRIKTKHGDHCRHLCGNSWCCNPRHIRIGTRASNEMDKHFHYFLRHQDIAVCKNFMDSFTDLCKAQGVWGRYPCTDEET